MPAMTKETLALDPIAALWRAARAALAQMLRAFGDPAAVARAACDGFRRRLAVLDSLVAKLLLIEAARSHALPARCAPSAKAGAIAQAARRSAPEDPARPETWRVRFHTRMPGSRRHARARYAPSPRSSCARPACVPARIRRLARRYEALRRVLADPRRAILALARKLRALGARAYAAARRIALAVPRGVEAGMTHAHALVHACDSSRIYRDTS
jgi:hypothetical protein